MRYSRSDWGARSSRGGPGPLDPAKVTGLVFHWPAMSTPLRTVAAVMAGLRGWQAYHMDSHGWSDIAYQVAVDQAGNRYDLRGLRTQPGANGDTTANTTNGAVLLVLAPNEEPSPEMVAEVRNVVADHRNLFPWSRRMLGHSDVRPEPTACPGPAAMRAIRAGTFNPVTPQEVDDMQLSDKLYPKQENSATVGDALKAVVRLEKAERRREETVRNRLAELRQAVAGNASKAEVERMLNNLDAEIRIVVRPEEQS